MFQRTIYILCLVLSCASANAQWDNVTGTVASIGDTNDHWFSVRGRDTAFLIDGDAGEIKGTLILSKFSPAIRPHMSANKIYSYGSFTRAVTTVIEKMLFSFLMQAPQSRLLKFRYLLKPQVSVIVA